MLNKLIIEDLEAKLVTRLDGVCRSASSLGALVAAKIRRVHQFAWDGGVVRVAVLARVGVLAADRGAVDDETVENVMGVSTQWREERKKSNCLHGEDETNAMIVVKRMEVLDLE